MSGFISGPDLMKRWRISDRTLGKLCGSLLEIVWLPGKRERFFRVGDVDAIERSYRQPKEGPLDPIADQNRHDEARAALARAAMSQSESMLDALTILLNGQLARDQKFTAESVAGWIGGAIAEVKAICELDRKPLTGLNALTGKKK